MHKKLYFSLAVFGLSLPTTLFAATSTIPAPQNQLQNTLTEGPESVRKLLVTLADWAFTIFLAVAVIMIVVAAFKYLTSGGGDSVKDAHKMLIYAVVAIIIAFLAKGFVTVVEGLVGVSSTGSSVPTSPPPTTPPPATPPPAPPISGGGSGSSRPGIGYFEISDPRVSLADTELLISLCPAVNDRSRPAVKINGSLAQLGGSGDVIEGLSWDTHIVDLGDDESIEVSVQRCPGDEYKPVVWANDEYYY